MNRIKRTFAAVCFSMACAWPIVTFAFALPPSATPDLANQSSVEHSNWLQPPITGMVAAHASNSTEPIYHIKVGDTLSHIANEFHLDVNQIITANDLKDPNMLHIGQSLLIPEEPDTAPQTPGTQVLVCTLTAYTSGPESTGKTPGEIDYGITSTGVKATQGETIAVDPKLIPYGSHVYIDGIGYRTAEDTGGAIIGDHIDVYYNNLQTALDFGVKHDVKVYVLPPVPIGLEPQLSSWQ